jgi:hypothetical protein
MSMIYSMNKQQQQQQQQQRSLHEHWLTISIIMINMFIMNECPTQISTIVFIEIITR